MKKLVSSARTLLNLPKLPCRVNSSRQLLVPRSVQAPVTIAEARDQLKDVVGSPKVWGGSRDPNAMKIALPLSQDELPARNMLDSYREAVIPLGSDQMLHGKYVNFHNTVRYGRIMEDLDTMAVWVGYTHNMDPAKGAEQKSPLSIVTAMVDRIEIKTEAIKPNLDIILRGHVSWVGKTSLEVTMHVDQEEDDGVHNILEARFLMVARDPNNRIKAFVKPLNITSAEEQCYFDKGEANKKAREQESKDSLLKSAPSEEERLVIHKLFMQTLDQSAATFKHLVKPEGSEWMGDSILKNLLICFPEERNLYNKIFGGFLMRQAFELAWANACVYSKRRPYILAIDDILFRKPVEVGSLLYLSSMVVYTNGPGLQIKVHAEVVDPTTGHHDTTNIFHYTFTTKADDVAPVIPKSYAEYMMYIDGKRHLEESAL